MKNRMFLALAMMVGVSCMPAQAMERSKWRTFLGVASIYVGTGMAIKAAHHIIQNLACEFARESTEDCCLGIMNLEAAAAAAIGIVVVRSGIKFLTQNENAQARQ